MTPATERGAFTALLGKEAREGFPWGVLGLVIMAGAVLLLTRTFTSVVGDFGSPASLMSIYPGTAFLGPAIALVIGLAQILPERRGDKWSFVVHRPVSRSELFAAKAATGVCLYLVAFGAPMAVAIAWAATPGHFAVPWDARMALPAIADLLCGLVFYFAALLVGMRDARWYATKTLAIGAAILCWQRVTDEGAVFSMAVVWCLVSLAVLVTAAWGTYVAGGRFARQPGVARAAVGVSIAGGAVVVGVIALMIIGFVLPAVGVPPTLSTYEVTSDGQIAQVVRDRQYYISEVNDLAGHPLARYADAASRDERRMQAGVVSGRLEVEPHPGVDAVDLHMRNRFAAYRSTDGMFQQLGTASDDFIRSPWAYYYVYRDRLIAIYDKRTSLLSGWLGPAGYSAGSVLPTERFPDAIETTSDEWDETTGPFGIPIRESVLRTTLLAFPRAVYRLDLTGRHVERLFVANTGEFVVGAAAVEPDPSGGPGPGGGGPVIMENTTMTVGIVAGAVISSSMSPPPPPPAEPVPTNARLDVVATTKQLYVLPTNGTTPVPVPVPYDSSAAGYGHLQVTRALDAPGTPIFLWYTAAGGPMPYEEWGKYPDQVTEIRPDGAQLAHVTIPPRPEAPEKPEWARAVVRAIATPLTMRVVDDIADRTHPRAASLTLLRFQVLDLLGGTDDGGAPPTFVWIVMILTSLASAGFIFLRTRRYAFAPRRAWLWTALGLAFGLLGVVLLLGLIEWPAREPCPACGRPRVVTRERCEHCGGTFAAPKADGTEIFETPALAGVNVTQ